MFLAIIFFSACLSTQAETNNSLKLQAQDPISISDIKIEELFYKKHLNTDYNPIKLEASLSEPIDVSIEDVLAKAIENNLNLKIAKYKTKAARWKFWNSFGNLLPDLSLNASKQKRDGTFYINSAFQAPIDETITSAGLRLNYRAFNGGASTFLALSDKYFKAQADAQEESQFNLTILEAVSFYLDLLQAQASLNTNLKTLERAKANYDLADKYLRAGKGTKFDLLQADARLARAQQELISQEALFRSTEIDLAEHLNIDLASALQVKSQEVSKVHLIDEDLPIQDFLKTAFKNNPDIRAALKNKKAISKQSFSTLAAFFPSLDLYFDLSGTGAQFDDLFRVTTLGFDLNYNIGEGLGVNAVAKALESKAVLKQAELAYLKELVTIEKNLRKSYLEFQAAKSLLEATEKEYSASKESYRLSQLRYQNGIEIFANLLDRESDLSRAQLNLIKATTDYNLSQIKLSYDMGDIDTKHIIESGI